MLLRDFLIRDLQRVEVVEVYQRYVNFCVFCLYFNCDKDLLFGNSFLVWEKVLLFFNLKEVVVEFLFGDLKKKSDGGGYEQFFSRGSMVFVFIIVIGDILK